jgi:hypothetical protein
MSDDLHGEAGVSIRALIATEDETEPAHYHAIGGGDAPEHSDADDDWAFDIPPSIQHYLKPDETKVIPVRFHYALLLLPALACIGGLAAAVALNSWLYEAGAATPTAVHLIWIAYLVALGWAAWRWLEWRQTWFVITGHRLLLIETRHLLGRKVSMLPIDKMRDVLISQTAIGRLAGYGTLDFASIGTERALDKVDFLPWPEWLYRHICDLSMPESERKVVKKRAGTDRLPGLGETR